MYIALDLGNVFVDVDFSEFLDEMVSLHFVKNRQSGIEFLSHMESQDFVSNTSIEQMIRHYFHNDIRYWDEEEINRLVELWSNTVLEVEEMSILLSELVHSHAVALLSNIGISHAKLIRTQFSNAYNSCIQHFSCDVGARKPSKLYFQSFLLQYPEFKGCVFIDDRIENLEAAKSLGFNAKQFDLSRQKDNKSAALELKNLILTS